MLFPVARRSTSSSASLHISGSLLFTLFGPRTVVAITMCMNKQWIKLATIGLCVRYSPMARALLHVLVLVLAKMTPLRIKQSQMIAPWYDKIMPEPPMMFHKPSILAVYLGHKLVIRPVGCQTTFGTKYFMCNKGIGNAHHLLDTSLDKDYRSLIQDGV